MRERVDIDVAPRPLDGLAQAGAGLLHEREGQPALLRHVLEDGQYVRVARRRRNLPFGARKANGMMAGRVALELTKVEQLTQRPLRIPAESVATHQTRETRRLPGGIAGRAGEGYAQRAALGEPQRASLGCELGTPSKP
jgi:hypothetical protein